MESGRVEDWKVGSSGTAQYSCGKSTDESDSVDVA